MSSNGFRVGLCLVLLGGVFSVVAYPQWSVMTADLNRECWGATQASSCTSIALSAGFWTPILIGSLALLATGLLMAIGGFVMDRRVRHALAPL